MTACHSRSQEDRDIDELIVCMARKICETYTTSYTDYEDYIQAGYLRWTEIQAQNIQPRSRKRYLITCICRAMREEAIKGKCSASASQNIKRVVHEVDLMMKHGKTDKEIQDKTGLNRRQLSTIKLMCQSIYLEDCFDNPFPSQNFNILDDILSCDHLSADDRSFLVDEFNGASNIDKMEKSRKKCRIKCKLARSGYEA